MDVGVEDEMSVAEVRPLPVRLRMEKFTSIPCVLQGSEELELWNTENPEVFSRMGFKKGSRVEVLGKTGWRTIIRILEA